KPGKSQRRDRRLDVCARRFVERSKLEACSHRSRTMNGSRWFEYASCGRLAAAALLCALAGPSIATAATDDSRFRLPTTQLETVAWSEIDGWPADDHAAAFSTFLESCRVMVRGTPPNRLGQPFYAALQSVCRRAVAAPPRDKQAARTFFEQNFRP